MNNFLHSILTVQCCSAQDPSYLQRLPCNNLLDEKLERVDLALYSFSSLELIISRLNMQILSYGLSIQWLFYYLIEVKVILQ